MRRVRKSVQLAFFRLVLKQLGPDSDRSRSDGRFDQEHRETGPDRQH
jgi:hypothetical protein